MRTARDAVDQISERPDHFLPSLFISVYLSVVLGLVGEKVNRIN